MGQFVFGLSSGIRAGILWLGFNLCYVIHWPLFVMDRGQYLIIPPLFDGTNHAYWKVRMKAFLQSLDEKMWQAMEIGWTKLKEAPADWDDAKIKAANFNSRALNALFNAVTNEEFKKLSFNETVKEAWTILQTTYYKTRLSRIRSFKGSLKALKRSRWRRMSCLMSSMPCSRT